MALDFPDSPVDGQQSAQPNGVTYQWNATKGRWEAITAGYDYIGSTAPVGAKEGARWWDNETGRSYIYYIDSDGGQWVEEDPQHILAADENAVVWRPVFSPELRLSSLPNADLDVPLNTGMIHVSVFNMGISSGSTPPAVEFRDGNGAVGTYGYTAGSITNVSAVTNSPLTSQITLGNGSSWASDHIVSGTMTFIKQVGNTIGNRWSFSIDLARSDGTGKLFQIHGRMDFGANVAAPTKIRFNGNGVNFSGGDIVCRFDPIYPTSLLSGVVVSEGDYTVNYWDSSAGGNVSPTTSAAHWYRIGQQVTVYIEGFGNFDSTGMTGANIAYLDLPFNVAAGANALGSVLLADVSWAGRTDIVVAAIAGGNRANFSCSLENTTLAGITVGDLFGGDMNSATITYFTDDP